MKEKITPVLQASQNAIDQIHSLRAGMTDPYLVDSIARDRKMDLWAIKLAVDQALCDAPVFVDEPAYHEIIMMMKIKGEV